MTAVLQRETDSVTQKLKEDMQRLASDIQVGLRARLYSTREGADGRLPGPSVTQLDMNNRKEETSQEMKQLDISIMVSARGRLDCRSDAPD